MRDVRDADDLRTEVDRLEAELRTFTVLRDNFQELYRQERDARIAAEREVDRRRAERDRLESEVHMLHSKLHNLRIALARWQSGQPAHGPELELRGEPYPGWTPKLVEGR